MQTIYERLPKRKGKPDKDDDDGFGRLPFVKAGLNIVCLILNEVQSCENSHQTQAHVE